MYGKTTFVTNFIIDFITDLYCTKVSYKGHNTVSNECWLNINDSSIKVLMYERMMTYSFFCRMMTSSCCGLLLYLNINKSDAALEMSSNQLKNTFLSTLFHFIICFVEHFVVIFIPLLSEKSLVHIIAPFFLLSAAIVILFVYYKYFHPVSLINANGPKVDTHTHYLYFENLVCCHLRKLSWKKSRPKTFLNGNVIMNPEENELQSMNDGLMTTHNV